jgi:hypothetical protein
VPPPPDLAGRVHGYEDGADGHFGRARGPEAGSDLPARYEFSPDAGDERVPRRVCGKVGKDLPDSFRGAWMMISLYNSAFQPDLRNCGSSVTRSSIIR